MKSTLLKHYNVLQIDSYKENIEITLINSMVAKTKSGCKKS